MSAPERRAIDLLDLAEYGDGPPQHLFRRLRREDPVHWHPEARGTGFWAVTRYDDVVTVSRDSKTFSSHRGATMIEDMEPQLLAGVQLMMLNMDPPAHTKLRALVNKGFTPRRVGALEPRLRELAATIVDAVVERGECDFVTDVAGELPSYVIAELVGIPLDDGRRLYALTERMHAVATTPEDRLAAMQAIGEMHAYASDVYDRKTRAPGEDIATALVHAEVDGERLTPLEFAMFFMLLVNAGGDTTRNLVGAGTLELLNHPEAVARLRNDAGLLPSAIEEMLRWVSPVVHFRRTATADVRLGERVIRDGDKVVVFYASANRDETVFEDPDRFDVARTPNEHLAFGGGGAHFCLGAHLARLEIQALLSEVLRRMPDLAVAGPIERLPSIFINGLKHMPVRFTPGHPTRRRDA
jgi:cytochrome P450